MMRGLLFCRLLLALALGIVGSSANAFEPEVKWTVQGKPGTFSTKQAAVSYMQSLTADDPRYPYLTKETGISSMSETTDSYKYEGEKIAPTPGAYSYQNVSHGGPFFGTESEVVQYTLDETTSASQCSPKTASPMSGWTFSTSGYGGVTTSETRIYEITRYFYNDTLGCREDKFNQTLRRTRPVVCPSPYSGETAAPGCYIGLIATIVGVRSNCEACSANRGNPGNALTGDKSESVTDYRGVYGLTFVRYYHSKSLDSWSGLGTGWSHNYQSRVVINAAGQILGLVRPNGYRESVTSLGGTPATYVSRAGSGAVAKKISSSLYKVFLSDGSVESYDADGVLTSLLDSAGRQTVLTYNNKRLSAVTGPFGHALTFSYDANSRLIGVTLPSGDLISFGYTGANLVSVTYPGSVSNTYHYENSSFASHLTGITDESSNRFATFGFDSLGRITLTEHAGNVERYTFAYNTGNTVVTDPVGATETFSFTTDANLARRVTQISKGTQTQAFTVPNAATDSQRRITQQTDANGNVTKFVYSTYGLDSKTEAFGTARARTTGYTYLNNDSDKPLTITQPGRTTSFTYDGNGNALTRTVTDTSVSPNVSRTWTYTYNTYGQVLTEDGPRNDVSDITTYTYYGCASGYQCGQLYTVTNPLGHVTTYNAYNAHGQPIQLTDANGLVTSMAYDVRQRLTDRCVGGSLPACSGSELTHLDYWPTGLLKKVTNPDGSYISYIYDAAHRLTEIKDGANNRIVYTLDNMGNRTAENTYDPSNALRRTHSRVFNTLNQLWKDVNAAGTAAVTTTFGYDNNGNQTSTSAPLSRNSSSLYDELNRLKQITDPASGITQFGYDANDNLTSVTDPRNLVTSYTYTGFGDLLTQSSPDTGVTTNTYDSGGNLDTSTDSRRGH